MQIAGDEKIIVAAASGVNGAALLMMASAIEEATGEPPHVVNMFALAGPNETLQLLMDLITWQNVLIGGGGLFLSGFLSKAGSDLWDRLKSLVANKRVIEPKLEELVARISAAAAAAQRAGNFVIIGLPIDRQIIHMRNIGVQLGATDPEAIVRAIATVGIVGGDILEFLRKHPNARINTRLQNGDASAAIAVTDQTAEVWLEAFEGETKVDELHLLVKL